MTARAPTGTAELVVVLRGVTGACGSRGCVDDMLVVGCMSSHLAVATEGEDVAGGQSRNKRVLQIR